MNWLNTIEAVVIIVAGVSGYLTGWYRGWGRGYTEAKDQWMRTGYRLGYQHAKEGTKPLHR